MSDKPKPGGVKQKVLAVLSGSEAYADAYFAEQGRQEAIKDAEEQRRKRDDGRQLTPIGLLAKEAAFREHPPTAGEGELKQTIRDALRANTEKDFCARLAEYLRQGRLRAVNPLNGAPYDPTLPNLDPADPMWSLDGGERETALELLGQLVRTDAEDSPSSVVLQSTQANAAEALANRERIGRGFYTLQEAAKALVHTYPSLDRRELLARLVSSVKQRELVVRDLATEAPIRDVGTFRDFNHFTTRADLDALFADVWRVSYRFPAPTGSAAPPAAEVRRVPAHRAQEETILNKLRELGFNPRALPRPPKSGKALPAKKATREALKYSRDVFDKAWQRLRKGGEVKDAEP